MLKNIVIFRTKLIVIFLLKLWPFTFLLLFHLLFSKVAKFFSHFTSLNELSHSRQILFFHIFGVSRVLSFKEKSKELQHSFFDTQVWILKSVLTYFSKASCHNWSKSLLHKGCRLFTSLQSVQLNWILMRWHLYWKFSFVIPTWSFDKLLKLVLSLEWILLIFVLNRQKWVSL